MSRWAGHNTGDYGAAPPSTASRAAVIGRARTLIRDNAHGEAGLLLAHALSATPNDPAFLHLFGIVRALQRRADEAETLYRRSLAVHAAQSHVHRDLGKLLAGGNRIDEGILELNEAIRLNPGDTESHLALAASFARRGDHAQARDKYREILRRDPHGATAKLGLAEALCRLGRPEESEHVLREAIASNRSDSRTAARLAFGLGRSLQLQKKFEQALVQFGAAQTMFPDLPAVDFARAETLQQMGRWEEAAQYFRNVLQRNPNHWNAGASLALICALLGDFAEARDWSAKLLALDPPHPIASIAVALCEIENGEMETAETRLRDVLEHPVFATEQGTAFAAGFVADAFDRHGWYRAAFAASAASNKLLRNQWRSPSRRITEATEDLAFSLASMESWSDAADAPKRDGEPAAHVFVLGFPRTGTTLLETILATESNVVHAHEVDFLAGAEPVFLASRERLKGLAAASENTIALWRDRYWKVVQDAKFQVAGKIFVDKMPVNTFRLPLIARLFPSAKIIFMLRDPRDVVLSCFRHHFDPTPYSYEFLRLEDCARLYAAAMQFADICRQKLPLHILDLRYEDLVSDFDGTIGRVCEFTAIPWNEGLRNFAEAAQTIDLTSASARQVRRGLYTGAAGHWRHYHEQLAPVLPVLAPWVARFGYPAD